MKPTLLMVGAGAMGYGYVVAARRLGLRVVLVDRPARRERYAPIVDDYRVCPDPAEETWLAVALDAAAAHRPDGVLAFSEPQVLAAAWVQDLLGLPGPSYRAAQATRNKALQRVLLRRDGVGQPEFHIVSSAGPALDWARARYPVVVKPLRGAGSAGVQLVADEARLGPALDGRWPVEPVLIEEYISAPEYSWEALVERGEIRFGGYTRKHTSGPPQFVELGHELPCLFPPAQRQLLDAAMAATVAALGIQSALVHLEFRFDGERLCVMETAVRTPGDHLMDLLALAYDHDFYESAVRLALGDPIAAPANAVANAAVGFLTAAPGTLEGIIGLDAARAIPGVVRVEPDKKPGAVIDGLESSDDRIAHVVAARPDGDASRVVADALAALSVSMGPAPELVA